MFTGRPGEWDAKIRERGWILREGGQWRHVVHGLQSGRTATDDEAGAGHIQRRHSLEEVVTKSSGGPVLGGGHDGGAS
ncbi:MAG UNVERIFIED_CONTAM: hypothetical protein LVR18_17285 [Planctomycetaceae bacterium]